MGRYYVHNLETDKLEIHTAGKADWQSLPGDARNVIKRACLWSPSRTCWVSRAKAGNIFCRSTLTDNGFEDRGTINDRLTFAEQIGAKQDRAAARVDRMEDRADNAQQEADSRFNSNNIETLRGMQGEPVKLGHHSAKRHLALIDRADSDMRKGCEAISKRDHYQDRAAAARATAEGEQYSNPGFLGRRIKEQEAEERDILRKMEGHTHNGHTYQAVIAFDPDDPTTFDANCSQCGGKARDSIHKPDRDKPTGEYLARLEQALAEVQDKLGFYRHCLETCGATIWTKETLAGKTMVFSDRRGWERIVRLNKTTVSVYNTCFPSEDSQRKYSLKRLYAEVTNAK